MGSTATSKAVKKTSVKVTEDSGNKQSARKTAQKKTKSSATQVKKKAAVRTKAATPKKATSKKAAVKKKAPRKKASNRPGTESAHTPDRFADATAVTGTTPGPADTNATDAGQEDSKSLSWMAAQAASALKAVRANQNARAQDLLAKAEITPSTPPKSHKQAKTLVEPVAPETKKDMETDKAPVPTRAEVNKPAEANAKKDTKADTTPDETSPVEPAPEVRGPAKPETVKTAVAHDATAQPETRGNVEEKQVDSPPAHVIAATSTAPGGRRSKRLFLLTGIIVLAGALGTRIWFSGDNTTDIATVQDSAKTEQTSPVAAKPSKEAISKVSSEPPASPATDAIQPNSWSPATHPAWPEPASPRDTLPTVATTPPETSPDDAVVTEPRQRQTNTQTTPAAPQRTSPAAPRPGYYAPAYGYYPQQPVRQQPYYRPSYSQ